MPTKLEIEMHHRDGDKGPFYMGNIRFPGNIDMRDLIVFFYPDTMKLQIESRREKDNSKNGQRHRQKSA
jgi:hypothetical protein